MRHRNYRLFWTGTLVSHTGDWMDQVALNWLVISLNGSATDVGLVNLMRGGPILVLGLFGGAIADRVDRRRLLTMVYLSAMILAVILTCLVSFMTPPIWALMLVSAGRGSVIAFSLSSRHSLVPLLVPRDDLRNAIALNAITLNLTKVVGPLLAGLVIAALGLPACFALNAASFLGVIWTLRAMDMPAQPPRETFEPLLRSIAAGFRYIWRSRVIQLLVLVALVPTLIGQPYLNLLVIYAHDVLRWGPMGLSILTASAAIGSVIGAMLLTTLPARRYSGRSLLALLGGFGLVLGLLATCPVEVIAPVFTLAAGGLFVAYNSMHITLLQMMSPDEYRGRVLSILFLNRSLVSFGTGALAMVAAASSIRVTYALMGLGLLAFAAGLALLSPRLRALRSTV